jgi:hypothetical protein
VVLMSCHDVYRQCCKHVVPYKGHGIVDFSLDFSALMDGERPTPIANWVLR